MEKGSFVFYNTFSAQLKQLPDELRLKFYDAIIAYGLENIEPDFNGIELAVWIPIKYSIDEAKQRYVKSYENGKKGGAPKGNSNAQKTTQNNLKQPKTTQNNLNVNVNDNVNDNVNENENVENTLSQPQVTYSDKIYELFNDNNLPCENSAWAFLNGTFKRTLPLLHDYHSEDIIQAVNNYISEFKNPDSWVYNRKLGFEIFAKNYITRFLPCNYSASANVNYNIVQSKTVTEQIQEAEAKRQLKIKDIIEIQNCPECNLTLTYFSDTAKWCNTCRTYYCWNKTEWIKSENPYLKRPW